MPATGAAEWLLDNWYIITDARREVLRGLPAPYRRELPRCTNGAHAGLPRAYRLACFLVEESRDLLDGELVARHVEEYQRVAVLTLGELWALPNLLRLAVLEDLAAGAGSLAGLPDEALPDSSPTTANLPLESRIGSCVTSLRRIAAQDWTEFVESVSVVERTLRDDPAAVYPAMDLATRDGYRKAVEELARWSTRDEAEVAHRAVAHANAAPTGDRQRHVGFHLVDRGRAALERSLDCRVPLRERRRRWVFAHAAPLYLGGIGAVTGVFLALAARYLFAVGGTITELAVLVLVASVPASCIAVAVVNWIVTHVIPPRHLPRLDFSDGITPSARTVVAIPTLLSSRGDVEAILRQLEINYQGNDDPETRFALLTDAPDAAEPHLPRDDQVLAAAVSGIEVLNARYGAAGPGPFLLLYRKRRWNPAEGRWMGWERKRGKLAEFNRLLLGDGETDLEVRAGDRAVLSGVRYVITLDADTVLPRESAARLVGTLAHPLNKAEFDARGRVVAGYTVLQPRLEVDAPSAGITPFARLFEGETGLDLYTHAVSDAYHDLFGEGVYAGKGVYEVAAFERSLAGRVPENALLSHDLFEGIHGRVGFLSDVQLFEDYPSRFVGYARRLHRWVRGDWQLLPWLGLRVPTADGRRAPSRLSAIDRWKIADNLRRSLTAPSLLLFLFTGWIRFPGSAWFWTVIAAATLAVPVLLSAATTTNRLIAGAAWRPTMSRLVRATGTDLLRWLLGLLFLAFEAAIVLDAIVRTLARVFVTRRHLLEWQSAAHTERIVAHRQSSRFTWRQMAASPAFAVGGGVLIVLADAPLAPALPFLLSWLLAPQVAHRLSRPVIRAVPFLRPNERVQLRRVARRTWHYFEHVLSPEDEWLAPDNIQEAPSPIHARRTSPTNVGMALLATLGACDLGYLGVRSTAATVRQMLLGLSRLERFRGHFLNWYDTRTLGTLAPRYVSAVDSGNLAAALITLEQGCHELQSAPAVRTALWHGLGDTVGVFREQVTDADPERVGISESCDLAIAKFEVAVSDPPRGLIAERARLESVRRELIPHIESALVELVQGAEGRIAGQRLRDLRSWFERLRSQTARVALEFDALVPWAPVLADAPAAVADEAAPAPVREAYQRLAATLDDPPPLAEIDGMSARVAPLRDALHGAIAADDASRRAGLAPWLARLDTALEEAARGAKQVVAELRETAELAAALVREMDFAFLYDKRRRLFHIGYDVDAASLDPSYYDLLASEARLASLVAIAKHDVAERHWLHLGRPFGRVRRDRVLLSWGGTMFEYLMPALLTALPEQTLITESCRAAVRQQMMFGQRHDTPWGISESGFYLLNQSGHYQYRAFGVPGLGLKRELGDRLVVAPYASLLALPFLPREVAANVARLRGLGALGSFGLYEAVDFGPPEPAETRPPAIVQSYMSHHQGMILVALANHLAGNGMVRRFHADARVASVEYLLYERVPRHVPVQRRVERTMPATRPPPTRYEGWSVTPLAAAPQAHLISNGRYSVLVTAAGGGGSRRRGRALTRWRAEAGIDQWGHWLYIEDEASGDLWSVGRQPVWDAPVETTVRFAPDAAEFRARAHGIAARAVVRVPPGDDLEIRDVILTNESDRRRRVALTSFFEVALAPASDDLRHQAFAKLFVESEILESSRTLIFRRRPGGPDPEPLLLGHTAVVREATAVRVSFDTNRAAFFGPGGRAHRPGALGPDGTGLTGTAGATLDPAAAIRLAIELEPGETFQVAFVTSAATTREELIARLDAHRSWGQLDRAAEEATGHAEAELNALGVATVEARIIQRLFSATLAPDPRVRPPIDRLTAPRSPQPELWRFGISGVRPILLLRAASEGPHKLAVVRTLLRVHAYLRRQGCEMDLVILDPVSTGYQQPLYEQLGSLIADGGAGPWRDKPGGVFLIRAVGLSDADVLLLETAARVALDAAKGSLEYQLAKLEEPPARLPAFMPTVHARDAAPALAATEDPLTFANGVGGFAPDGAYVLQVDGARRPPRAWTHVLANPSFGCVVSATGGGFTWSVNSAERRLTPWRNDPVADWPGEVLYLRDEETGAVWSATPAPAGEGIHEVHFAPGVAEFRGAAYGLRYTVRHSVAPEDPVKLIEVTLANTTDRARRLTATFYAEWVLGTSRHRSLPHLVPEYEGNTGALLVRNPFDPAFADRVAFLAVSAPAHGLTTDRIEFVGEAGDLARPAALDRVGPAGSVAPGGDICGALQVYVGLEPGEQRTVHFVLGDGENRSQALELVRRYVSPETGAAAAQDSVGQWSELLGSIRVQTPDRACDLLLNGWLLYQTTACRLWARSALSQSGGAFGFRDQLQDVLALAHVRPDLTRMQILEAARHQFEEGDVLHWWHPGRDQGVRTRCSDDLVWLPYTVAHYVRVTGDAAVLDERVPFLSAPPLRADEGDRFDRFDPAPEAHSLYVHCLRALDRAHALGVHGLPLFGSGDWNDGMNRVGKKGAGESVWLAWFLVDTLRAFAPLAERRGDAECAASLRTRAENLSEAVERTSWDGAWYRRGYYDDGTPLGSASSDACRIDSLAQSWAVVSGGADPTRAQTALASALEMLLDEELQVIRLFDPPFDDGARDPGYIRAYPPGIRENGGQYTHAAIWLAWAVGLRGDGDLLGKLFTWLNPVHRTATPDSVARYQGEPYAVAADISTTPLHRGAAGWTWYTGSAAWLYRLGLEIVLGVRREADRLVLDPCIPRNWEGFTVTWRLGRACYRISVTNPVGICRGVVRVSLDGKPVDGNTIPFVDDGREHVVEVVLGKV